jgi:hypothetical protein
MFDEVSDSKFRHIDFTDFGHMVNMELGLRDTTSVTM